MLWEAALLVRDLGSWAALAIAGASALILLRGRISMGELQKVPADLPPVPPKVSVIFAARDEEDRLEDAVKSLLSQDYPGFEVVGVDDRSDDRTPAILEQLASSHPRLRVLRIERLPAGWLGKTHALDRGAAIAEGDVFLFCDADVHLKEDTLAKAVAHLQRQGLDHLALTPDIRSRSPWVEIASLSFALLFSVALRPWRASHRKSGRSIGVGAFNLVRQEAYQAIGGHRPLALSIDDDLALGRELKKSGFRQECLLGRQGIWLEWYPGLGRMVDGLTKNAFAALGYRLSWTLATALLLCLCLWPWPAVLLSTGPAVYLNLASCLVWLVLFASVVGYFEKPFWYAPALPLGFGVMLYALLRSAALTIGRGGVVWRGTHYPLRDLKAHAGSSTSGTRKSDGHRPQSVLGAQGRAQSERSRARTEPREGS